MQKIIKILFSVLLAFSVVSFSAIIYCDAKYPSNIYSNSADKIKLNSYCTLFGNRAGNQKVMKVLGILPVKDVTVSTAPTDRVVVSGTPFGVMLYSQGVMVVGSMPFESAAGEVEPGAQSGIRVGDIIHSIDGVQVNSIEEVTDCVKKSNGKRMIFLCSRNGSEFTAYVTAQKSKADNLYHIGLWVRDSSAGIGTMTFYYPALSMGVGFGHPICDVDTGNVIDVSTGCAVNATIYSLRKSAPGNPGELLGALKVRSVLGEVLQNCDNGVYFNCEYQPQGESMPLAYWNEVTTGKAQIYTTLEGQIPQYYDVRIEKINAKSSNKNFVIIVTDPRLIEQTGGIVQGMSGSPIIQNGKLVGAMTHVFVDDPTSGYGIFAETMLKTAQSVADQQLKDAS